MSVPEPTATSAAIAPHLAGLRAGEIVLATCGGCGLVSLPRPDRCRRCGGGRHEWRRQAGEGRIWSFVEFVKDYLHRPDLSVPYVVALVELDAGAVVMASVAGSRYGDLRVGQRVRVGVESYAAGPRLVARANP
ncbi:Zn-ribbon domain-containing OB-fold protein [Micromonospora sp. NPDC049048]|uniref:Zn-ribbon domain-containing OB-fold protein n=1 Tax=Micromonospora sp. NPDC049048 TaxID=3364263 RepID=UPI00372373B9